MAGEWEVVPLEALLAPGRRISYGIVQPGSPVADGVPIVRVSDVRNGRIDASNPLRVDPAIESSYSRTRLTGGELILTLVGTVGEVAVVPPELAGWNVARAVAVIPVREDVGAQWVKLALAAPGVREVIGSRLNTTVQATLNLRDVAQLPVVVPPVRERGIIAHILGSLEEKIELNRQMSQTLDAIARAVFKSWFVEFAPVRAKARSEPHESICRRLRLTPDLLALFPDSLVDSELGEIPEGWGVATVGSEFDLTMGQSPPGDTYNETSNGLPFYQGRTDFGFRFPTRRVHCTAPSRLANAGDTLVSVRAPVGDINMATEVCAIGRGVAAARHKTGSRSYTYQFMRSLAAVFARFEAEGTVFGSIGSRDFHAIACVKPPRQLVLGYDTGFVPFDDRIEMNERESITLAALHDSLLPKVMSGGVRVPLGGFA